MENNMSNILDLIASGEAAAAKDALNDMLSAKAFQALDTKKQEIAQSLYGNNVVSDEEQTAEVEETETIEEPQTEE